MVEQDRSGRRPDPLPPHEILRVIVGSHAFGTATEDSDRDVRSVFVAPTWDFFKVDHSGRPKVKETIWVEGTTHQEDVTGWEVGRFIQRATHCDPNTLQVLWAPVLQTGHWGEGLRGIRSAFLSKRAIYDAFSGYSKNQARKMLEEPMVNWTVRNWKFAEAYLRALMQGYSLLTTGELVMNLSEARPADHRLLVRAKHGEAGAGEVVQRARWLQDDLFAAYNHSEQPDQPDIDTINVWLRDVRVRGWGLDQQETDEPVFYG